MGKGSRWKRWSLTWLVSRSPREPFAFILRPSFAAPFVWEHQSSGHTWTMTVISPSTLHWSCFLTRRIIGKYFKDKWRKRLKKFDCGPNWLSSIRLPRMPWFLTPNWKRVEGQQRNGLNFFQVFGAVCSGSRWLQYKIAAVGGLHLFYSIQAFIEDLIWAQLFILRGDEFGDNFNHVIVIKIRWWW